MDFKIPIFILLGILLFYGISSIGFAEATHFACDIISTGVSQACFVFIVAPSDVTVQCNSPDGKYITSATERHKFGELNTQQEKFTVHGIGSLSGLNPASFPLPFHNTSPGTAWHYSTNIATISTNQQPVINHGCSALTCAPNISKDYTNLQPIRNHVFNLGPNNLEWTAYTYWQAYLGIIGPFFHIALSSSDTQLVHVVDNISPTLNIQHPVLTIKSNTIKGIPKDQIDFGTVTMSDVCFPNQPITNNIPEVFTIGSTVVTYTTTDGAGGNTVTKTQTVNVEFEDMDGDGITDEIDTEPNVPSNDFDDLTDDPNTEGTINTRGDQGLTIGQEPIPDGILFDADNTGGADPAMINACDNASNLQVDSGDSGTITCGSVTIEIISGSVDVQFNTGGIPATTTMVATNSLTFADAKTITNNSLIDTAEIKIGSIVITIAPGESINVSVYAFPPTSKTSYQDPNLGDVRHGEGHDNGFCMNQNCINVDGFFNHFPETIVPQGSTQTFSLLINCPRGVDKCNHASIEGVLPDSDFYEEQWGVTLERLPRSDTWEATINNPYGEIGEVTTTVQEVDQSFLSISYNIEFLIPGSIGTADGIGIPNENNRHLHVTVWDNNRGISNYIFNEGVYVDDIYAYPQVETSYEKPIELEPICNDMNTNKRYTCAFDKVRDWTIQNAEKALLEIEGKTELDVLNEEFLLKFKELKQAIADGDVEKISELRTQLDDLGNKIHNLKQ